MTGLDLSTETDVGLMGACKETYLLGISASVICGVRNTKTGVHMIGPEGRIYL